MSSLSCPGLTRALDLSPSLKGFMTNSAFLVTLRMFWELPEGLQLCCRAGKGLSIICMEFLNRIGNEGAVNKPR